MNRELRCEKGEKKRTDTAYDGFSAVWSLSSLLDGVLHSKLKMTRTSRWGCRERGSEQLWTRRRNRFGEMLLSDWMCRVVQKQRPHDTIRTTQYPTKGRDMSMREGRVPSFTSTALVAIVVHPSIHLIQSLQLHCVQLPSSGQQGPGARGSLELSCHGLRSRPWATPGRPAHC